MSREDQMFIFNRTTKEQSGPFAWSQAQKLYRTDPKNLVIQVRSKAMYPNIDKA